MLFEARGENPIEFQCRRTSQMLWEIMLNNLQYVKRCKKVNLCHNEQPIGEKDGNPECSR